MEPSALRVATPLSTSTRPISRSMDSIICVIKVRSLDALVQSVPSNARAPLGNSELGGGW